MTAEPEVGVASRASTVFLAAEHGDFREFEPLWEQLQASGAVDARAWALTLGAIRWVSHPRSCRRPDPAELTRLLGEDAAAPASSPASNLSPILARACAVMERASVAALDPGELGRWVGVHSAILDGRSGGGIVEASDISLRVARLWLRLLVGEGAGADAEAKQLFEDASRLRAPAQVVESTVLRALLALSSGESEPAVELARRASRMAQAESLPQLEYLANVTLARVRRYSGRPHLALHILVALARVAPAIWSGWIAWEVILAGGEPTGMVSGDGPQESRLLAPGLELDRSGTTPSMAAASAMWKLLQGLRDGDRSAFERTAAAVRSRAGCWWDLSQEAETLLAAVDASQDVAPAALEPWRRGETTTIPCGLHAIGIPRGADLETETATAFVLADRRTKGRRVLRPGLTLFMEARLLTRESAKSAAAGVRTETGIAALALAGPGGLSREDFFRAVYGFSFVPHRHQAVLDVLSHRMRNLLGDAGELRRDVGENIAAAIAIGGGTAVGAGPSLALHLRQTIVVPDMRCALPTSDRVLRALATLGTTSASLAAESLRMPLRTVQAVLQQLVAEGACTVERDGRRVSYRIEDTTFTEVTSVSVPP